MPLFFAHAKRVDTSHNIVRLTPSVRRAALASVVYFIVHSFRSMLALLVLLVSTRFLQRGGNDASVKITEKGSLHLTRLIDK